MPEDFYFPRPDNQRRIDGHIQGEDLSRFPQSQGRVANPETYGQPMGNPDAQAGNSQLNQATQALAQEQDYARGKHEEQFQQGSGPVDSASDPKPPRLPKPKAYKLSKRERRQAKIDDAKWQAALAKGRPAPSKAQPVQPPPKQKFGWGIVFSVLGVVAVIVALIISASHSGGATQNAASGISTSTSANITPSEQPPNTFVGTPTTSGQVSIGQAIANDTSVTVPYSISNPTGGALANPATAYLQVTYQGATFTEYPMSSSPSNSNFEGNWTFRYYLPGSYAVHYAPSGQDVALHIGDSTVPVESIFTTDDPGTFAVIQQSGANNTTLWVRVVTAYQGSPPTSRLVSNGETKTVTAGTGSTSLANPAYHYTVDTYDVLGASGADYYFGNGTHPVHVG